MRYVIGALLVVLLGAGAVQMGAGSSVVIGAVYPTGGGQGTGGTEEYRGVTLAVEYANRRGGWRGRPYRLQLAPANSWDAAPFAVERLQRNGVTVVVGSYGSTISRPAAESAARLGMVFWETGAVGELGMAARPGRHVFRFAPTGQSLGRAAVAFVRDRLAPRAGRRGPLRYAVVYVDDVYGRAVASGAMGEVRASGQNLAAVLPYDLWHVDDDALAQAVRRSRADVVVAVSYLDDGVAFRRALLRHKVPLLATIGTSSGYCMPEFGRILGRDAVGTFASDKPDGDVLRTTHLALEAALALEWGRREYRRRYGDAMSAPALSGFAGGIALLRYVLPHAKSLSAADVGRAALEVNLPEGALPNGAGLLFAPPGNADAGANLRATSVIWQWVRVNTRAIVWPPAYATHPIVVPSTR